MSIYNEISRLTPTSSSIPYIQNIEKLLLKTANIEGDIVEFGVFKGTNSVIICKLLKYHNIEKKYYGFDTFKGYTDEDLVSAKKDVSEENLRALQSIQDIQRWSWSKKNVDDLMESIGCSDNCEIIVGDIKEVFPEFLKESKINKISLLYIDCNAFLPAYMGTKEALPLMDENSIISIDEHMVGGETKALKSIVSEYNFPLITTGNRYPHGPPMYAHVKK